MIQIPVIDLSRALCGDKQARKEIAAEIDQACRDIGFITIKGHGIDPNIFKDVYASLNAFYALPQAIKDQCITDVRPCHHQVNGYSALLAENAHRLMGKEGMPSDYLEKFSMGRSLLDDDFDLPFPDHPTCIALRANMKRYYEACLALTNMLTELFAIALDLPEDYFADKVDNSWDYLRLHHYPARPPEMDHDQGFAEHADMVFMTILTNVQDGLEVLTKEGNWVKAKTDQLDQFIVNIGDCMQRWSNDEWVSTIHRVTLTKTQRQSIIFFKTVNEDTMIETFPKFLKNNKPKYEPIAFEDYVGELAAKLFGKK